MCTASHIQTLPRQVAGQWEHANRFEVRVAVALERFKANMALRDTKATKSSLHRINGIWATIIAVSAWRLG